MKTKIQNGVLTAIAEENQYITQTTLQEGEVQTFWKTIGIIGTMTADMLRDATEEEKQAFDELNMQSYEPI